MCQVVHESEKVENRCSNHILLEVVLHKCLIAQTITTAARKFHTKLEPTEGHAYSAPLDNMPHWRSDPASVYQIYVHKVSTESGH